MKVFVKEAFPGNGRFHLTLDPDISPEDLTRMKNALQKKKARFSRRKNVADLVVGEEMLGGIVRVREFLESTNSGYQSRVQNAENSGPGDNLLSVILQQYCCTGLVHRFEELIYFM